MKKFGLLTVALVGRKRLPLRKRLWKMVVRAVTLIKYQFTTKGGHLLEHAYLHKETPLLVLPQGTFTDRIKPS